MRKQAKFSSRRERLETSPGAPRRTCPPTLNDRAVRRTITEDPESDVRIRIVNYTVNTFPSRFTLYPTLYLRILKPHLYLLASIWVDSLLQFLPLVSCSGSKVQSSR